jgi:hypothetical protein
MINSWKVFFTREGKKYKKTFVGDSPRPAVDYGKQLKRSGVLNVELVSASKAFAPPKDKLRPPEPGMLWCPYCLKWRFFREFGTRHATYRVPAKMRCPVCTISITDYYVRKYNPVMIMRVETQPVKVAKPKSTRRARGRRGTN